MINTRNKVLSKRNNKIERVIEYKSSMKNVSNEVSDIVCDQVWNKVEDKVRSRVEDKVWSRVKNKVRRILRIREQAEFQAWNGVIENMKL